jgi:hypothetical protein
MSGLAANLDLLAWKYESTMDHPPAFLTELFCLVLEYTQWTIGQLLTWIILYPYPILGAFESDTKDTRFL